MSKDNINPEDYENIDFGFTAADEDEFSVSANGGSGGVARLTFGSALSNADGIVVWFFH